MKDYLVVLFGTGILLNLVFTIVLAVIVKKINQKREEDQIILSILTAGYCSLVSLHDKELKDILLNKPAQASDLIKHSEAKQVKFICEFLDMNVNCKVSDMSWMLADHYIGDKCFKVYKDGHGHTHFKYCVPRSKKSRYQKDSLPSNP